MSNDSLVLHCVIGNNRHCLVDRNGNCQKTVNMLGTLSNPKRFVLVTMYYVACGITHIHRYMCAEFIVIRQYMSMEIEVT